MPDGALPVFSVDTEEEAKLLIISTCPKDYEGNYYSRELAANRTIPTLFAFGEKIAKIHDILVKNGSCKCKQKERKSCSK